MWQRKSSGWLSWLLLLEAFDSVSRKLTVSARYFSTSQRSSKSKFLWAIPFQLCQLNYLLAKGGAFCDPETGLFGVNFDKMQQAVSDLTHDILVLQGNGDKKAVAEFVDKYGKLGREIEQALNRIEHSGKLLLLLNWS